MMSADSVRLLLATSLALAAVLHTPFSVLLVGVMLFELAGVFFSPAESALLPLVVPAEDIVAAKGVHQSSAATAGLAGKLLGGPLLMLLGAPQLFLVNAASFVVSLVSLWSVKVKQPTVPRDPLIRFRYEGAMGFRTIWKSPGSSRLMWSGILVNFGVSSLTIVLTTWVKVRNHGTVMLLSLASGAFLIGSIIGGVGSKWSPDAFL
ncbi:MFS transporter [Sulfobacillus thermosulfidooxidans]|uniref:MFS transporter n=1 Tax=Sulfobacillus thermosulfidooxidans TaxID=28034 RepID=UPI0006B4F948